MSVSRLRGITGIGVDRIGSLADRASDPEILRLENLDTDIGPPTGVNAITQLSIQVDQSNSYLPFSGKDDLRRAATDLVNEQAKTNYNWDQSTIICAGGLNGILNTLLAILEPDDEVILSDPIYIGLINRVRLCGASPIFVRYREINGAWVFDQEELKRAVTQKTKAFLMMSPSMPSGAVLSGDDWHLICELCKKSGAWLIYNAAMQRILYDQAEFIHPASFPGMADRTITVGSVSKEYRMIGWRTGWIVGPADVMKDIALVSISNVVCPVGVAQAAATAALRMPASVVQEAVAEWQNRRDFLLHELRDFSIVRPMGGWSMLLNVSALGIDGVEASKRLFERGRIAATPMTGWGREWTNQFVRLVFSNEPVSRLQGIRGRFQKAFV